MQKSKSSAPERLFGFVEQVELVDNELILVRIDATSEEHATTNPFENFGARGEFVSRIIEVSASPEAIRALFAGDPMEDAWVELELHDTGVPAIEYRGPIGQPPVASAVSVAAVRRIAEHIEADLAQACTLPADGNALTSLHKWRRDLLPPKRKEDIHPRAVEVLNVGQGSCNRIFGDGWQMYFDVGGGCYWNAHTYREPRELGFEATSLVVLSHWDMDHWYTAWVTPNASKAKWLVPRQPMGRTASEFAASVKRSGNLIVWPDNVRALYFGLGRVLKCTGSNRNDSGLAMDVVLGREANGTTSGRRRGVEKGRARRLLLPGDARYESIPTQRSDWAGLVASHHGSQSVGAAPRCVADARMVYSFGQNNSYRHPSRLQTESDTNQGWRVFAETVSGSVLFCPRDERLCPNYLVRSILQEDPSCTDQWHLRPAPSRYDRLLDTVEEAPPCVLLCRSPSDRYDSRLP